MPGEPTTCDALILGAGGAGLFCAATAASRGRSVTVLDHQSEPGRKILISGGGRCNFTNIGAAPDRYLSGNPHFVRSALARFTPQDFVALVRRHRIPFHEKKLGQLFCDGKATAIVSMLLEECRAAESAGGRVDLRLGCRVGAVSRPGAFRVETSQGTFEAPVLVVATGGPSVPKIGATDIGYRLARQFGLRVIEPRPALVPFTMDGTWRTRFGPLSGLSFPAEVGAGTASFREQVLLTHRGLSGPAILQASSYWQPGTAVSLNLFPEEDPAAWLASRRGSGRLLGNVLAEKLPARLAEAWLDPALAQRPISQAPGTLLAELARRLSRWELTPAGTEGWQTAEVALGGVDTRDLSSQSLEARAVPGLHFIGEVVDVTGWLGGYNFQWAWASASACGQAL